LEAELSSATPQIPFTGSIEDGKREFAQMQDAPDALWRRAGHFAESKGTCPESGNVGDYEKNARQFLKRYRYARMSDCAQLQHDFPALSHAHRLYEHSDVQRWLLEAALVAGKSAGFIAVFLAVPEEVVVTYEKCFYDVRRRLKQRGWVMSYLLSPVMRFGAWNPRDRDIGWKYASYVWGWETLLELLGYLPYSPETVAKIDKAIADRVLYLTWQAAIATEPDEEHAFPILVQSGAFNKSKPAEAEKEGELRGALTGLFNSIKLSTLPSDVRLPADEPRTEMPQFGG
jgi:hypothetical protein